MSGKVMAARVPTRAATGCPVSMAVPKSPRTKPAIHAPYCTISGRSRPICARSASTRSGGELRPAMMVAMSPGSTRASTRSGGELRPAMMVAMSPGSTRNARKITTEMAKSATTNSSSRRAR